MQGPWHPDILNELISIKLIINSEVDNSPIFNTALLNKINQFIKTTDKKYFSENSIVLFLKDVIPNMNEEKVLQYITKSIINCNY